MKINYKYTTIILSILVVTLTSVVAVLAGNTDSPSGPTDAGSQMYTLEQIYNRLDAGTTGTKMTTFTEPSSGPGSTMHTLDEIMAAAPEVSATGAVSTEVRAGKTFWGLTTGEWGLQSGKLYGGCHCANGTLNGTRWCDNGDGTVTDLLGDSTTNNRGQCLVWLKNANCSAYLAGINKIGVLTWDDAVVWSSVVSNGICGLTDASTAYEWRLPTRSELESITHGTEYVHPSSMGAFTNVQSNLYWSSTSYAGDPYFGWLVYLNDGGTTFGEKSFTYYVWPVRGGK